ncbi:MAG: electron transfer flavoprotein beta subunit [Acidimicrobiales bacterium]|jgi:electron transfer flavoprotein beta subunit
MNILVCVKRVPAPGSKINVTDDGLAVDAAHLGFTTSPHEECALEEAVQITERDGGQVTVLTLGPVEAEEQLRYAASVGAHKIILVPTNGSAWDPQRTAAALTVAIQTAEETNGEPFELILFGNESADSGGFQVGVRVAHKLGRPIVNAIKGIDPGDGAVTARREIDAGFEVYNVATPAVLGVKEGINLPRYPTMKGRLASKKAELTNAEIVAEAGGQTLVKLHRPAEQVSNTEILGTDESAAGAVVDILEEIGLC